MEKIVIDFNKLVGMGGKVEFEYSVDRDTIEVETELWYLLDLQMQELVFNQIMATENYKNKTEELYNLENDYRDDYEYEFKGGE